MVKKINPFPPLNSLRHTKRGLVPFAPTLGLAAPLCQIQDTGASATPHEVGANAPPRADWGFWMIFGRFYLFGEKCLCVAPSLPHTIFCVASIMKDYFQAGLALRSLRVEWNICTVSSPEVTLRTWARPLPKNALRGSRDLVHAPLPLFFLSSLAAAGWELTVGSMVSDLHRHSKGLMWV